jgi:hypothetical protein
MGQLTTASGTDATALGYSTTASGMDAVAMGQFSIAAGIFSLAAGQQAKALHNGTFVWADAQNSDFASSAPNQFLIRAAGGVGIGKTNPAVALDVNGTVAATAVGIGTTTPTDSILDVRGDTHINDFDLLLRANSDRSHGLGYRATWDGPFLYGYNGGALGVGDPDTAVLSWDWLGDVTINNSLTVPSVIANRMVVDSLNSNTGAVSPGLVFGASGNGEGIASKRTSGGNQNGLDFYTGYANRLAILNGGNVGIGTNNPTQKLVVAGNIYATGTITPNSDRNLKTDFAPVDAASVLERVTALPIQQWRFQTEPEGVKHFGPMAQDFRTAFGLGEIPTAIATVDADGVALAAIQGLNRKLETQLEAKDAEIGALKQRLDRLEHLLKNSQSH